MQTLILSVIATHQIVAYAIIFLALFLEGDALLFGVAFLAHQKILDIRILIPLVFLGALVSDLAWYAIGRTLDRTWPWLHSWIERVVNHFDKPLMERTERTIILSKFTYGGICRALIMRAGSLRMKIWQFVLVSIKATIVWMVVVGGLGYAASAGLTQVGRYLRFAEVALAVAVIVFVVVQHATARRLKRRLEL